MALSIPGAEAQGPPGGGGGGGGGGGSGGSVTVTAVRALKFGDIAAPGSGSNTFTVAPTAAGTMTTGGAGDGFAFGNQQSAQFSFQFAGQANKVIAFEAFQTSFADGGLTITSPLTVSIDGTAYSNPGVISAVANTLYTVHVGGTLQVTSGAGGGMHTDAVISFTANFN